MFFFFRPGALALALMMLTTGLGAVVAHPQLTAPGRTRGPSGEHRRLISRRHLRAFPPAGAASLKGLDLTRLFAADANNIWLAGEEKGDKGKRGVLLQSLDGGETWTRRASYADASFHDVRFFNPRFGVAVGYAKDQGGIVLKSEDGGVTWGRLPVPLKGILVRSQFIDAKRGWVLSSGGSILSTANGGLDWRVSPIAETSGLNSLSFTDELNGWVVGEDGQAFKSSDGGASWRPRGGALLSALKEWHPVEVDFRGVKFFSAKAGVIAAQFLVKKEGPDKEPVFDYGGAVLRTEDGGETWKPYVGTRNLGLANVHINSGGEVSIIPTWGWSENTLFRSFDEGQTWVRVQTPEQSAYPIDVFFVDRRSGWLLSDNGMYFDQLFRTRDGGTTWIELTK